MPTRMRALARGYPRDADIATLAAEAMLNLHPYDWWAQDGSARPWTAEIRTLLTRALAIAPGHPGANHYWIHLMESSAHPGAAQASAERLTRLVPGSGHLAHMPAHIHMRTGRYAEAVAANERAIAADERYLGAGRCAGRLSRRLRRAQSPFPVGCRGDGRAQRHRARRRARRFPVGLRSRPRRPQHGDPAALLRAAAVRAGALRPLARDSRGHAAARRRRALSARHLALRARHRLREDGRASPRPGASRTRSPGSPPIRRCSERASRTSIRRRRSCASPR